jgi:fatty-acyl-CoA synthase
VIISGGENIDLNRIEQALTAIDGIAGAVVLSRPDKKWGARPIAFVEIKNSDVTVEDIMAALEKKLPRIMLPDKIILVESLPKTAAGKFDRQELARRHSKELSE